MSQLLFVRHGQASFLSDDYDQLSPLGESQAVEVGMLFLREAIEFDAFHSGPRKRQLETARIIQDVYRQAKKPFPKIDVLDEFDEHQLDRVITRSLDTIAMLSPTMAELVKSFECAQRPADQHRTFQMLFEETARHWISGRIEEIESWEDFRKRVLKSTTRITSQCQKGSVVGIATSVGPIGIALQRAIQCSDETSLTTSWRIQNASITEFVFSGSRFTLDRFNDVRHLRIDQRSYR